MQGFGLADALLATLLLGAAALVLGTLAGTLISRGAQATLLLQADGIAGAYLAAMAVQAPASTPCNHETGAFNSLACFHGLDEPPHRHDRTPITALDTFRVQVTLAPGALAATTRITVRVSHPQTGLVRERTTVLRNGH